MPGFWLFRFFPSIGHLMRATAQPVYKCFLALQERGWNVTLARQTYYQAVSLGAALKIAKAKDRLPGLSTIHHAEYEKGIKQLEKLVAEQGKDKLIASHICVAEGIIERKV